MAYLANVFSKQQNRAKIWKVLELSCSQSPPRPPFKVNMPTFVTDVCVFYKIDQKIFLFIRLSGYCFWILMAAGGGWLGRAVPAAIISSSCATAASSKRSAAAATPGKSDRAGRARATERGKAATFGPTPASQLPAPCLCRPRTFDLWALLARAMPRSQ